MAVGGCARARLAQDRMGFWAGLTCLIVPIVRDPVIEESGCTEKQRGADNCEDYVIDGPA